MGVTKLRTPRPVRYSRYLAWIRTLPCVVCGVTRGIEASHTGPHGLGQKSPDSSAIPLCAKHHRTGADSYHRLGPRKFSEEHKLDIPAIVRRFNSKPTIRVEAGSYVADLDDQKYVLGKTEAGLGPAVRQALQLCKELRVYGGRLLSF
jgi:Protein of unknown function (DUF968)